MIRQFVWVIGITASILGCAQAQILSPVAHNVISEDLSDQRRIVAVRVERRLDDPELQRLAALLQAHVKRAYNKTQINVFLPGMPANQSPWASVTCAPQPKIAILGLTHADEQLFLAEHRADTRPLLGSWLTSPPATSGRLAIYSSHGKIYTEWRLRGGQKTVEEVYETVTKSGRRFDIPGAGFYVLTRAGDLEIWDKSTLIAIAERIRPEHLNVPPAIAVGPKAPVVVVQHMAPLETKSETAPIKADGTAAGRPASPVAPEPKFAASIADATTTSAPAALPPVTVMQTPQQAPSTIKKSKTARVKPTSGNLHASVTAVGTSRPPATPGDLMSAKLAGRY